METEMKRTSLRKEEGTEAQGHEGTRVRQKARGNRLQAMENSRPSPRPSPAGRGGSAGTEAQRHEGTEEVRNDSGEKARELHIRQSVCAQVLENLLGKLSDTNPALWDHAAYLAVVGSVYEQLVTGSGVPIEELVAMSKILGECRKFGEVIGAVGDVGQKIAAVNQEPDASRSRNRLIDLYGASLQNSGAEATAGIPGESVQTDEPKNGPSPTTSAEVMAPE